MSGRYKIAEIRKEKGLTQKALAERIGTTQQAVARWEAGDRDLKGGTLMKMSNAMGVSVAYLLGIGEDGTSELTPYATHMAPIVREIPSDMEGNWRDEIKEHHPVTDDLYEAHPLSFWFAVQGNSMNKLFADKTLILVDPRAEIVSSDVVLVLERGGNAVPKRVFIEDEFVRLHPESHDPEYADKVVRRDDPAWDEITFIGKVISYTAPIGWRA